SSSLVIKRSGKLDSRLSCHPIRSLHYQLSPKYGLGPDPVPSFAGYFNIAWGRPKAMSAFFSHLLLFGRVSQLFTASFLPCVTLAASEPGTKTDVLGSRLSMIVCAAGEIWNSSHSSP